MLLQPSESQLPNVSKFVPVSPQKSWFRIGNHNGIVSRRDWQGSFFRLSFLLEEHPEEHFSTLNAGNSLFGHVFPDFIECTEQ